MSSSASSASPLARRLAPCPVLSDQGLLVFLIVTPFVVPPVWADVLTYASWPLAAIAVMMAHRGIEVFPAAYAVG